MKIVSNAYFPGCVVENGEYIWISLIEENALIRINKELCEAEYVSDFANKDDDFQIHSNILMGGNKLIFAPWNSQKMDVFSLNDKSEIINKSSHDFGEGRFIDVLIKDDLIYMESEKMLKITEFDVQHEKVTNIYRYNGQNIILGEDINCSTCVHTNDDIWLISRKNDISWKFNLNQKKYEKVRFFTQEKTIIAVCSTESNIWILTDELFIYQYNCNCEIVKVHDCSKVISEFLRLNQNDYIYINITGNILRIFSYYNGNVIVTIPYENNRFDMEKYEIELFDKYTVCVSDSRLYIITSNKIRVIDEHTYYDIRIKNPMQIINKIIENRTKLNEDNLGTININHFLGYILNNQL